MPSLAITGTLGSGKTFLFHEMMGYLSKQSHQVTTYSADEENRRLLQENTEVRLEIASTLGKEYLDSSGIPDRVKLSSLISADKEARKILEGIMHPRLESLWRPLAEQHKGKKSSFFVAEIPLLYEKELSSYFDKVLVIGCSDCIRKSRLSDKRSISNSQAEQWLSIQQSQDEKTARADHLFWNDGSPDSLNYQISQLLRYQSIA
ncbi:MAG: dephospho-CoA kinase [Proteobacteria bacterium]|nr:dephospho-CoA kinase [Pseudomonadota bacterium]